MTRVAKGGTLILLIALAALIAGAAERSTGPPEEVVTQAVHHDADEGVVEINGQLYVVLPSKVIEEVFGVARDRGGGKEVLQSTPENITRYMLFETPATHSKYSFDVISQESIGETLDRFFAPSKFFWGDLAASRTRPEQTVEYMILNPSCGIRGADNAFLTTRRQT